MSRSGAVAQNREPSCRRGSRPAAARDPLSACRWGRPHGASTRRVHVGHAQRGVWGSHPGSARSSRPSPARGAARPWSRPLPSGRPTTPARRHNPVGPGVRLHHPEWHARATPRDPSPEVRATTACLCGRRRADPSACGLLHVGSGYQSGGFETPPGACSASGERTTWKIPTS